MRRHRNAKIIATLGPATDNATAVRELFEAGVDIFRLNFSHGDHEDHRRSYDIIRALEEDIGRPIGVMIDLQGPKLRLGNFRRGRVKLSPGARFRLDLEDKIGDHRRVYLPHPEVFAVVEAGTHILIDDGRVRLRVDDCGPDFADTTALVGGVVADHKGVNLPGVVLPVSPFTAKDHLDLQFGLELGCDWVALSFVQRPEDITEARALVGDRAQLLAKLERPAAIDCLEEIIAQSDAIMVARGDLGVELPPETVPGWQKQIVRSARRAGKPVVIATQMLDSMMHSPQPTRAEASDVATAVYDGADAVMLSNETAVGDYPIAAVDMMHRIIRQVERDPLYRAIMDSSPPSASKTTADAITGAARQVAESVNAAAILTYTDTGSTTLRAARARPTVPILCMTPRTGTARYLAIAWGVHAVIAPNVERFSDMVSRGTQMAIDEGFVTQGDRLVITAGVPFGSAGATNILHVAKI